MVWWIFGYLSQQEHLADKRPFTAQYRPKDLPPLPLEGLGGPQPGVKTLSAPTPPDGYAWVDRKAGIARVPVARAEALLAGRLPVEGKESKP